MKVQETAESENYNFYAEVNSIINARKTTLPKGLKLRITYCIEIKETTNNTQMKGEPVE